MNIINICVYGTSEDEKSLTESMGCLTDYAFRRVAFDFFDHYDNYIEALKKKSYDAIFVTVDNAEGMEGVIAAKTVCDDKPVVWFSNDRGFGPQSYRLGCAYFSKKSFTDKKLAMALSCCCTVDN